MKLEIGHTAHFSIREEEILFSKTKKCKIMHLSDLHLNKYSQKKVENMIDFIEKSTPDLILLGGDYVDTKKGLIYFNQLLRCLSKQKNVVVIPGNHDLFFGKDLIMQLVNNQSINWLQNSEINFLINGKSLVVSDIPSHIHSEESLRILLIHNPKEIMKTQDNYDIAFAGHLHGSQFVFWKQNQCLYPGRLFYKYNRLKMKTKGLTFFINKGLGDTLPIRYNCSKEIIVLSINPSK